MTFYRGRYARRAEILVETFLERRITTPGILGAWVTEASQLPPNLREWVFLKIEPSIGPNAISYLRSLLPEAVPA